MKVFIGSLEHNFPVTSHILESDPLNPDRFAAFHCWRCGKILFQFSGNVVMSVPGVTKTLLPIINLCTTCKQKHLINSIL